MEHRDFDALARSLAAGITRRGVVRVGLALAGAVLGGEARPTLAAARKRVPGAVCSKNADCLSNFCLPKDRTGRRVCAECGTANDCPAGDQCHGAACIAGVCATPVKPSGTACDDGNRCTTGDVCQPNGACVGVNAPVDCVLSDWSGFSACSAACGGGTQTRTRSVVTPASCGGQACLGTTETQPCNTQACGTCDATQVAAFCTTVTAVDGTQHCGRPNFGPSCCDTDADCATNSATCSNIVPQFCATTEQLADRAEPFPVTCVADPNKAGVCCCLAACDLPT